MSNLSPVKSLSPKKLVVMTAAALTLGGVAAPAAMATLPTKHVTASQQVSSSSLVGDTDAKTRIIWVF